MPRKATSCWPYPGPLKSPKLITKRKKKNEKKIPIDNITQPRIIPYFNTWDVHFLSPSRVNHACFIFQKGGSTQTVICRYQECTCTATPYSRNDKDCQSVNHKFIHLSVWMKNWASQTMLFFTIYSSWCLNHYIVLSCSRIILFQSAGNDRQFRHLLWIITSVNRHINHIKHRVVLIVWLWNSCTPNVIKIQNF